MSMTLRSRAVSLYDIVIADHHIDDMLFAPCQTDLSLTGVSVIAC